MNRLDYENYVETQKVNLNSLNILIGEKKVIPYITGCFEEDGVWKIYMVGERHDLDIVQEGSEEEIFNTMHSITVARLKF